MPITKDIWAWTFALAVAGYPLIGIATSIARVEDNAVSIAFRVMIILFSAACYFFVDRGKAWRLGSMWLFVFAGFYLTKLLIDVEYDIDGASNAMLFAVTTSVIPACFLAASTNRWHEANTAFAMVTVGATCVSLTLWLQYNGSEAVLVDATGRVSMDRLNPISIGHAAVTTLIACYALLPHIRLRSARLVVYLIVAAAFAAVYFAGARGPLVSLVACCLVFHILRPSFRTVVWCLLVCIGAYFVIQFTDLTTVYEKFNLGVVGTDRSTTGRVDAVGLSWGFFKESPVFGWGTQLPFVGYPHNIFMEVLQATGIVGMSMFCGVLFKIWQATDFMASRRLPLLPLLTTQFLVGAQFSGSLYGASGLWIVVMVIVFRANSIKLAAYRLARNRNVAFHHSALSSQMAGWYEGP